MAKDTYPVWFGKKEKKLYDELVKEGLTSKPWPRYCKDAFYNQVDRDKAGTELTGKHGTKKR